MDRLSLGDVRIHRIEEWQGVFLSPQQLFTGFDEADYVRVKTQVPEGTLDTGNDEIHAQLQSWVVDINGMKVLIDTGAGNHKERPGIPLFGQLETPFIERLAAAGFAPEDIDMVICTHLHVDHVGWNTKLEGDAWVPAFPRARAAWPWRGIAGCRRRVAEGRHGTGLAFQLVESRRPPSPTAGIGGWGWAGAWMRQM